MDKFNLDSLTYIIPMALPLWISIFIFVRDPHNSRNRLTSLTMFTLFAYFLLGAIQTSSPANPNNWILPQRIFGWALVLPGILWAHLGILSWEQHNKSTILTRHKYFGYILAIFFTILISFSDLIFNYTGTQVFSSNYWPVQIPAGILYPVFFAFVMTNLVLAALIFLRLSNFSVLVDDERKRFKYLFFATIAFISGGSYLFVNVEFGWFRTELPGTLMLLLGVVLIIYGLLKYKGIKDDPPQYFWTKSFFQLPLFYYYLQ